jgi:hypothetical protein
MAFNLGGFPSPGMGKYALLALEPVFVKNNLESGKGKKRGGAVYRPHLFFFNFP